MTKFKKNTHTSLSLLVDPPMLFDSPERMCMHQTLSLSEALSYSHLQIRFGSRSDPNGIKERKYFSPIKKIVLAIESTQCVAQMPMRTIRSQNIEFLSNTGPDPLKFSKLPSQHSTLGHHRHPSETPFKLGFAGGPMMARF